MSGISCIVVAAGQGLRAETSLPKQYVPVAGKPIVTHTLENLLKCAEIDEVICVIAKGAQDLYDSATKNIHDQRLKNAVTGGKTRSESVKKGLSAVQSETVLIHDAARPFTPVASIQTLIEVLQSEPAAFLGLPITDTVWRHTETGVEGVDREHLWRAQTPQGFKTADIIKAFEAFDGTATDDVGIAQRAGIAAKPILGSEENFKITHPEDFERAERMLQKAMNIRVGNGYDVHALEDGEFVTLNGIQIPHAKAMIGHSDADVAMHAITDAIYGALAKGDIGQHFPPSDPQWKGAQSDIFLRHAAELAGEMGYSINNIDCTIICEQPKIGPHADAMRKNLAQILNISADSIGVKATTSERLGFTGRQEGIAAQATATLVSS